MEDKYQIKHMLDRSLIITADRCGINVEKLQGGLFPSTENNQYHDRYFLLVEN